MVFEEENVVDHNAYDRVRKVVRASQAEGSDVSTKENCRGVVSLTEGEVYRHMEIENVSLGVTLRALHVSERIVGEEILVCWSRCRPCLGGWGCACVDGSQRENDFSASPLVDLWEVRKSQCLLFCPHLSDLISTCLHLPSCLVQDQVGRVVHLLRRQVCSSHPCLDA